MEVATEMEEEQQAAWRQTHLDCPIVARYCCLARAGVAKVHHVHPHVPNSGATEERLKNQQVDQAAKTEVAQVDLDWQQKGELFVAQCVHVIDGLAGLVECKTKDKRTEAAKSRRANKGTK